VRLATHEPGNWLVPELAQGSDERIDHRQDVRDEPDSVAHAATVAASRVRVGGR
jgi:hypothetical protein